MSSKLPRLRFYADENFPAQTGKFLRSIAQNVEFAVTNKTGRGKSDTWQLKYATKNRRVLLVLDNDFRYEEHLLELTKKSFGVLLIQSANPSERKIVQILRKVMKNISQNKIFGKICIASVDKISYIDPNKIKE